MRAITARGIYYLCGLAIVIGLVLSACGPPSYRSPQRPHLELAFRLFPAEKGQIELQCHLRNVGEREVLVCESVDVNYVSFTGDMWIHAPVPHDATSKCWNRFVLLAPSRDLRGTDDAVDQLGPDFGRVTISEPKRLAEIDAGTLEVAVTVEFLKYSRVTKRLERNTETLSCTRSLTSIKKDLGMLP